MNEGESHYIISAIGSCIKRLHLAPCKPKAHPQASGPGPGLFAIRDKAKYAERDKPHPPRSHDAL